uniref:Col_cuticle_N domain-containing protein n=1 Tax=Globodera pallida TaxID=36090 RepID=A0A183C9Q3_GLOPA
MHEAKIVVGIASLCSLAAILATLIVIPQLYTQINEVNSRVMDGVQAFRVNTDSAWSELMEVQISVTPPSRPPAELPSGSSWPTWTSRPDNRHLHALPPRQRVRNVQLDHPDNQEAKDHPDHLETMDSPDNLDRVLGKAHLVRPALKDSPANLVNPEDLVSLANLDSPESKALLFLAHRDRLETPEHQVSLAALVNLETLADKGHPGLLEDPANLETPERQEVLDSLASLDSPATTALTVLARHVQAFSLVALASLYKGQKKRQ